MNSTAQIFLRHLIPALQEIEREIASTGPVESQPNGSSVGGMSVRQVARELGCSASHVYSLLDRDELGHVAVGKRRVVTRAQLAEFLRRATWSR